MILGLLPASGAGLTSLQSSGQHGRLVNAYFKRYAQSFEQVYYFSYFKESLADFSANEELLERVTLLPRKIEVHRRLYGLVLPFLYGLHFARCAVLRVFQLTGALPALVAKKRYGIPYVTTYGYRYAEFARLEGQRFRALWFGLMERSFLQAADGVIVTTPTLKSHVARYLPEDKIHYIPNGTDTALFRPRSQPPSNDPPVAIFVGRLEPQKNLFTLLEAVAIVGNLRLVLVGDGSQREALAQRARELGVALELAGVVSYETLPTLLQTADLFVLPSLIEGHPKVLLEAMSVGLPCVGTDVPGIRDLLQDGETGLLCPGTDPASLVVGLRRLLADRTAAQELSRRARALIEAQYDLDRLLQREVALLQQLAIGGT